MTGQALTQRVCSIRPRWTCPVRRPTKVVSRGFFICCLTLPASMLPRQASNDENTRIANGVVVRCRLIDAWIVKRSAMLDRESRVAARLELHPKLVAGFGSSVPKAVKHLPPLRSVQTLPLALLGDWLSSLLSFHIQAPGRVSSSEYQSDWTLRPAVPVASSPATQTPSSLLPVPSERLRVACPVSL